MKHLVMSMLLTLSAVVPSLAKADNLFTGDVKLSCEAVLCLSTGKRPDECTPPIKKYFSISHKKLSDTLKARRNFLKLCPASNQDSKMAALVDAIANGAGRCDAASLNSEQTVWVGGDDGTSYISNAMPSYCTAYSGNAYTDLKAPMYVGTPEQGGYWVEGEKYAAAAAAYNAQIQAAQAAAEAKAQASNNAE